MKLKKILIMLVYSKAMFGNVLGRQKHRTPLLKVQNNEKNDIQGLPVYGSD